MAERVAAVAQPWFRQQVPLQAVDTLRLRRPRFSRRLAAASLVLTLGVFGISRDAFAATLVDLTGGTLTITGDNAPNDVSLEPAINNVDIFVDLDGDGLFDVGELEFNPAIVNLIVVDLMGDNDNFDGSNVNGNFPAGLNVFINLGEGNDTAMGTGRDDFIDGGGGDDLVSGGDGDDTMAGGNDNDTLRGQADNDNAIGGSGADLIEGGNGNDSLDGGSGNDTLKGEAGNDTLSGGADDDSIDGGAAETDRVIELPTNANFTLTDTSLTGLGTDVLVSIEEASLRGGSGPNVLNATAFSGNTTLHGGDGSGKDTLQGGSGNDSLQTQDGDDFLFGNAGEDTLSGQAGNDTFDGGASTDTVTENKGFEIDTDWTVTDTTLTAGGGGSFYGPDALVAIERVDVDGGNNANTFDATASTQIAVTFNGLGGSDTLRGGALGDLLIGGTGNDSVLGGAGDDILIADESDGMTITGGPPASDTLAGGAGNDSLFALDDLGGDLLLGDFDDDFINYGRVTADLNFPETFFARAADGPISPSEKESDRITELPRVAAIAPTTINGGGGNDSVETVGSAAVQNIDGGPDSDTLKVDDMGLGGTDSGSQIVVPGSQPINYSNFEAAAVVPVELLDFSVE